MSTTVKEMDRVELVNLERLAYILKGLSTAELETLELLLDEEAFRSINQSIKELEKGEGTAIEEWRTKTISNPHVFFCPQEIQKVRSTFTA